MYEIRRLLADNADLSNDQIIDMLKWVGSKGDIIIIKNDGIRDKENFTVVITSSKAKFDAIRYDNSILGIAVKNAILSYCDLLK